MRSKTFRMRSSAGRNRHVASPSIPYRHTDESTKLMGSEQSAGGHHSSAAAHHGQAPNFHREAASRYKVGKDYVHAAHQALVAHGHAMRALEHGHVSSTFYAEHNAGALPGFLERATRKPAGPSKPLSLLQQVSAEANGTSSLPSTMRRPRVTTSKPGNIVTVSTTSGRPTNESRT